MEQSRSPGGFPLSKPRPRYGRLEEPKVRLYVDTAIVWFAGWIEGVRDGRPVKSRFYLTRVYLKRGGQWQLVHQQSALPERVR